MITYSEVKNGQLIDWLMTIWKADLSDKINWEILQDVTVSLLLYGCTTQTFMKCLEKKLDENYTKMLYDVLNKYWKQNPRKLQLYGYLPPISQTI